jgi:hypothetical protein
LKQMLMEVWENVWFGFFYTADLGQQYEVVSRVAGNFSYLSTSTFFSVSHSAWYALSLPKSVYPGLFHPVGFSCVWARTPSLFMVLCYAGIYLPVLYYRRKARVLGALAF